MDEHESRRYHILVNKHDKDHADAYLALLAKLRDRGAVATALTASMHATNDDYADEMRIIYLNLADALLAYLEVRP